MKKSLFLSLLLAAGMHALHAADAEKETITLTSDKVYSETFTETEPGNGMFYSDANGVAFLGTGTTPYYISNADDTSSYTDGISLSKGGGTTVSVGSFTGESHLVIGNGTDSLSVTTENSLFIGGYGWHNTNGWKDNASLNSSTEGTKEFAPHSGSVTVNKGSTLEVGTGIGSAYTSIGGTQIYIGHGAQGTLTVDGGEVISNGYIGISTSTLREDDNSGLLEIKNGGKVIVKAQAEQSTTYYNQILVGGSTKGTGSVVITGEGSELIIESTSTKNVNNENFISFFSIGSANGNGDMTVDNGATLTVGTPADGTTYAYIGEAGDGSLTVGNEGTANINASQALLSYNNPDGSSTITVEAGGELNLGNETQGCNTFMGYSAADNASLIIENGGTANIRGNVMVRSSAADGSAAALQNDGTINLQDYGPYGTAAALHVYDGTAMVNNGTISDGFTVLNSGAEASGTGTFSNTIVSGGATLTIGTINEDGSITAGSQTHTGNLELLEGATLTFAIDDLNGDSNSMLILSDGASLTVDEDAVVRLYLSDAAIEQSKELGDDFSLQLVSSTEGGETTPYVLSNIEIYDTDGLKVEDVSFSGQVDENGNITITNTIPEPTTATLSLLALAALAARRRRK